MIAKIFKLFAVGALAFFIFRPTSAWAVSESIKSFNVGIVAHRDGTMDMTETIDYDFASEGSHGIFRYIPRVSRVGDLYRQIGVEFTQVLRDGVEEKYDSTYSTDQAYIKIGDPDKTIDGQHTYVIKYRVDNGIGSNYEDHDEIYWNSIGNKWIVPIEKASISVVTDFGVDATKAVCFTGVAGSTKKDCRAASAPFNPVQSTKTLQPGEGLTVVFGYPVGTFPKSTLTRQDPVASRNRNIALALLSIPILGNFILAPTVFVWYLTKKRKNRFGPVAINFDIPKDESGKVIPPAEAGTIDTAKLERDDVVATIFDLAIRKYIRIDQVKDDKKVLGIIPRGKDDYTISRLKGADDKNTEYEKTLMDTFFAEGETVSLSSLKKEFYKTFTDMEKGVFDSLVARDYYTKNPSTQRALLVFGAFASLFTLSLLLAGLLFFLSKKLNGRTASGDEIDWKIDGLKLFLKKMDRNYKWQADQLAIVEKMIPYAMALGYIEKFMATLQIIKPDYNPTWYSGRTAFYNAAIFSSLGSNITTSAPSSSSGFSGGGSSGGGGGGGGGGSW